MLINLSNHPHDQWSSEQLDTAQKYYGYVEDIRFPMIPPSWNMEKVRMKVDEVLETIRLQYSTKDYTILVAGEQSFIVDFMMKCQRNKISCITATSERTVVKNEDGSKNVRFKFVRFRKVT